MSRRKREVGRIRAKFEWVRGFNMDVSYSKYLVFCIGTAILLYAVSHSVSEIINVIAPHGFF